MIRMAEGESANMIEYIIHFRNRSSNKEEANDSVAVENSNRLIR
jgi:hypothetical protein